MAGSGVPRGADSAPVQPHRIAPAAAPPSPHVVRKPWHNDQACGSCDVEYHPRKICVPMQRRPTDIRLRTAHAGSLSSSLLNSSRLLCEVVQLEIHTPGRNINQATYWLCALSHLTRKTELSLAVLRGFNLTGMIGIMLAMQYRRDSFHRDFISLCQ